MLTEALEGGLDHQFLEMFTHIAAWLLLSAPPRRHGRHTQFLSEQLAAEYGQKSHLRCGFHKPASKRIVDDDGTIPHSFDQTRDAQQRIAAQLERIAEGVVDAPQDHIDRFQTAKRFEIYTTIEHGQIRPFNQRETPLRGKERMFKVGFVMRPGREKNDRRIRPLISGQREQRLPLRFVKVRQRPNLVLIERIRQR